MAAIQQNEIINGRYVLKQSRGRGTFGEVWLAHDLATEEDVAIKFYVALDNKGRDEFIQEFRIAAKLRHPNLLVTKDFGVWEGHPYLTMKYCDHGSAADLIGTLTPCTTDERTIWRFIRDVAAGLACLHAVKPDPIVHQDIKPDNTLIDTDGTFLITDFGISKRIRNTMSKQSKRALQAGAPPYMAPERFSAYPDPILASDVWSLGSSIYELAEGELPFCGMGGVSLLNGGEMPSLGEGWSQNLNDIMHWCLEKEAWNRARADQVQKIAETVLKSDNNVSVAALIAEMKGDPEALKPPKEELKKKDPRATNPHVNGFTSGTSGEKNDDDATPSNHRPLYGGIAALVLLLAIAAVWYFSLHKPVQSDEVEQHDTPTVVVDSVAADTMKAKTPRRSGNSTPEKIERNEDKVILAKTKKHNDTPAPPQKEDKSYNGTLSLGYATWHGDIRGGKADGDGTMTFTSSHRIDTRDPSRRKAEAGDRIEGTYSNGHLVDGRWFKSDGSTEYIMLGE